MKRRSSTIVIDGNTDGNDEDNNKLSSNNNNSLNKKKYRRRMGNTVSDERILSETTNDLNAVHTRGLLPLLIQSIHNNNNNSEDTASSRNKSQVKVLMYDDDDLCHIYQRDRWSCGYRNMQMLLSCIMKHDSLYGLVVVEEETTSSVNNNEPVCIDITDDDDLDTASTSIILDQPAAAVIDLSTNSTTTTPGTTSSKKYRSTNLTLSQYFPNRKEIPTVADLQHHLEYSWAQGFDPQGAAHYRNLKNWQKSWLGASEVSSFFKYCSIDSTVVEFIRDNDSRGMLGPFVYEYFSTPSSFTALQIINQAQQRRSLKVPAAAVVQQLSDDDDSQQQQHLEIKRSPKLPLYFQWQGHSVTIIGVTRSIKEKKNEDNIGSYYYYNYKMYIFDPMKSAQQISTKLEKNKGWQDILEFENSEILRDKIDCQVIVCTPKLLNPTQRFSAKEHINGLLAKGYFNMLSS